MKLYQFKELHKENFNAGSKAVEDVNEIGRRFGAKDWGVLRLTDRDLPLPRILNRLICWLVWKPQEVWLKMRFPRNAVLLVQHPITTGRALTRSMEGLRLINWLRNERNMRVVTLVHDISELRSGDREVSKDMPDSLPNVLGYSDVMIVHNRSMHDWLTANGAADKEIIELGIFDYLTDAPFAEKDAKSWRSLTFAGNLRPDKCGFLRRANELAGIDWYLYGPKFDSNAFNGACIHYCGCMKPAELTRHLNKGFGLVWDGDELETCSGEWGGYLRWNNPHKLSLYLASGLPVVTWSEAATAEFIKKHDVGIVVKSLEDLPATVAAVTRERYSEMRANARKLAEKLRTGYFLSTALRSAMAYVCH